MTQSLHAIVWCLFIIWLPNLMRAMHVYLTSIIWLPNLMCAMHVYLTSVNGVCVCVLCVLNTLYVVYHTSLNSLFSFGYTLSLFPEISSCALLCRNFKLASLSIVLRNSRLFNRRLVTPKYLR